MYTYSTQKINTYNDQRGWNWVETVEEDANLEEIL